jgi:hypothetical protein
MVFLALLVAFQFARSNCVLIVPLVSRCFDRAPLACAIVAMPMAHA